MTDTNSKDVDAQVQQVLHVLDQYKDDHSDAQIKVRRQNSVSIRIRIVDRDFGGLDHVDREPAVWNLLKTLPKEVFANITMLLLLTPDETEGSLANQEFEDPIPSRL
jgi:stress-induced morphogen